MILRHLRLGNWPELNNYYSTAVAVETPIHRSADMYCEISKYLYPHDHMGSKTKLGKYLFATYAGTMYRSGNGWAPFLRKWNPFSWPVIALCKLSDYFTQTTQETDVHPDFKKYNWDVWTVQDAAKYDSDVRQLLSDIKNTCRIRYDDSVYYKHFND